MIKQYPNSLHLLLHLLYTSGDISRVFLNSLLEGWEVRGEILRVKSTRTGFKSLNILSITLECFLGGSCACCSSTISTWVEEGLSNDFKHDDWGFKNVWTMFECKLKENQMLPVWYASFVISQYRCLGWVLGLGIACVDGILIERCELYDLLGHLRIFFTCMC